MPSSSSAETLTICLIISIGAGVEMLKKAYLSGLFSPLNIMCRNIRSAHWISEERILSGGIWDCTAFNLHGEAEGFRGRIRCRLLQREIVRHQRRVRVRAPASRYICRCSFTQRCPVPDCLHSPRLYVNPNN